MNDVFELMAQMELMKAIVIKGKIIEDYKEEIGKR